MIYYALISILIGLVFITQFAELWYLKSNLKHRDKNRNIGKNYNKFTFTCSKSCHSNQSLPKLSDRPKLEFLEPDLKRFMKWSDGKGRIMALKRALSKRTFDEIYQEVDDYVDDFWQTRIKIKEVCDVNKYEEIDSKLSQNQMVLVKNLQMVSDDLLKLINDDESKLFKTVPPIFHYTWFSCNRSFKLYHFLSVLSILKAEAKILSSFEIWFHTDCLPTNSSFWGLLKKSLINYSNFKKFRLVILDPETSDRESNPNFTVWDRQLANIKHYSDVYRLMVLLKFGGIYLDNDIIQLKSINNFLSTKVPILGEESIISVCNGFIISPSPSLGSTAVSNNRILKKWLFEYKYYSHDENLATEPFSVMKIWALWRQYPKEIQVEHANIIRPFLNLDKYVFREYFDWRNSYNLHFSERLIETKYKGFYEDFEDIECANNTFGEIARRLLFGDSNFC